MPQCKRCGSYAINPHCHGREPGVDLDLCDVCYWRKRAEQSTLFEQTEEDARRQRAAKALYDETMLTP